MLGKVWSSSSRYLVAGREKHESTWIALWLRPDTEGNDKKKKIRWRWWGLKLLLQWTTPCRPGQMRSRCAKGERCCVHPRRNRPRQWRGPSSSQLVRFSVNHAMLADSCPFSFRKMCSSRFFGIPFVVFGCVPFSTIDLDFSRLRWPIYTTDIQRESNWHPPLKPLDFVGWKITRSIQSFVRLSHIGNWLFLVRRRIFFSRL